MATLAFRSTQRVLTRFRLPICGVVRQGYPDYSTQPAGILSSLDTRSKSEKIQSSIKLYLKRVQQYENMLESEREEFERGRRYLAQIMGENPETFNQDKIDESINYLFPSGLFSRSARPKLKEAVYQLESLKNDYDRMYLTRDTNPLRTASPLVLVTTDWLNKTQLEDLISETLTDTQYEQWLTLVTQITNHPLAYMAEAFIFRFRLGQTAVMGTESLPEPELDPVTGQRFVKSYGQKRHAFAEITLRIPGTGQLSVNGKRLLEAFPDLGNREQIMFPLQVTQTLGTVDITATVTGVGTSSPANSIRLAIARCLASVLPKEQGENRLRVTGLLTQDERFAERKNPGQRKARKKPIWKAR